MNDSIKICHSILNGFPSAEAAEILSRSALYLAEVLLAIGETDEAREYLTECIQWSQQLGNPERVRNANVLLSMIHSTRDNARIHKKAGSYKCAKCGKVLEEILETPRNATNKGETDKRTFAQAMKCNKCGAMLCWPSCCKMEPCPSCRSTAGFHSTRVYVNEMVKALFSPAPDARKKVAELTSAVFRLYKQGQYGQARPISEEAVRLSYEWFGEEDPDTASCLNNLGLLQKAMGKLAEARPFYERALSIRQNILGVDHPHTVDSLINLGLLLSEMGDPEARHYFEMVLASRRKVLGPNHPVTADCLTDLGLELMVLGDLKEARSCLEQALAIHRNTRGSKHPKTAASLLNLGTLLHTMGDLPGARRHYEQALPICHEVLGPDHPHSSICLHSLGALFLDMGELAEARSYLDQALTRRRKVLGPKHPDTAGTLFNLGVLLHHVGDLATACTCYEEALSIFQEALGLSHPDTAGTLLNLGTMRMDMNDLAGALNHSQRALAIFQKALGPEHPRTALGLGNLGHVYAAMNRIEEAWRYLQEAAVLNDRKLGQVFSISSERQRMAILENIQEKTAILLSLVWQYFGHSPERVRATLDLVLRRKAVGAEALGAQRDAVLGGKYPNLQPLLQQLFKLRMQIAQKTLDSPGPEGLESHRTRLDQWEAEKERLETELARQVPEMNLERKLRASDRRAVALAMPQNTALIEFIRFNVFDFHAVAEQISETQWKPSRPWKQARYLAFVLFGEEPDEVRMIDLGEAEPIDQMIADFRAIVGVSPEERRRDMVRHRLTPVPAAFRDVRRSFTGGRVRQACPRPRRPQAVAAGTRWRPVPASLRSVANRRRPARGR